MAFCYQCGKPISEQAKFCPYCGYHIEPKKSPAPEPEVEAERTAPHKGKKEKVDKRAAKKLKGKKGKREEPEEAFEVEDFAQGEMSVAYTVEQKPAEPTHAPVHHAQRTEDNPLPSRDVETHVPSLSEESPVDEDRFGWVWIAVGVIILLVVLVVIWFLLFSGYY